MNNETHNSWRSKLDEPAAEPGFNKVLAWDRLEERLTPPAKKRSYAWYWLAASCIAALCVPLFLQRTATKDTEPAVPVSIVFASPDKQSTQIKSDPIHQEANPNKELMQASARHKQKPEATTKKLRPVHTLPPVVAIIASPDIVPPADSAKSIAIVSRSSKQLKVVQINELKPSPATAIPTASAGAVNALPDKKQGNGKNISGSLFNLNIPLKTN
ncbi:MAG: hypothetical protein KGO82_03670 [Bacteroidota bacterium]|nr:hypothetical protein [Bacteroidota bacterium]